MSKSIPKLLLIEKDSTCTKLLAQGGFELTQVELVAGAWKKSTPIPLT